MMALAARSAFTLLGRYVSQNLAVAAAIAAAAAVYAVMALALGAVTADDLSHFKNGQKWSAVIFLLFLWKRGCNNTANMVNFLLPSALGPFICS